MIDRIRQDIQERLDEILAEADKLRRALVALDPRDRAARAQRNARPVATEPATTNPSPKAAGSASSSARTRRRAGSATNASARSASGATKAKVLSALSSNGALTATEVAKATGLGRASVSTTLSKLAKSGEIAKAQRGYRLPGSADGSGSTQASKTAAMS